MKNTVPNQALGESNAMQTIRKRAEAVGIPMKKLFRETKQDPGIISRWTYKEPKALKVLRVIDQFLTEEEQKLNL